MATKRKGIKTGVLVFLLFALFPLSGLAAPSIELLTDKTEAVLQDTITLRLRVSGAGSLDSPPQIQGLEKFSVASGGTTSHIEIINFRKNAYIEYLYSIQPRETGTYTIGPAEIRDDGAAYRSNLVTLTIRDVPKTKDVGSAAGPLILKAELSKNEVYSEEPVIYTVRFYRLVKVSNLSLDIPDNPSLTFKKIGEPLEYESVINGQPYQVLEVRHEVTPLSKGRITLPPATMNMVVYGQASRQRAFPFNDPFFSFSTPNPKVLTSNPLELNVLQLPREGRPADFSSLVGRYVVRSQLDKDTVSAGDTASLTVTIEGRGNVSRIPDLSIPEVPDIKTYADKPAVRIDSDADGYKGSKTMKWAFVPQKEGVYVIPPLSLSYFDTGTKTYRSIRTPAYSLKVLPGALNPAVQTPSGGTPVTAQQGKVKREVVEIGRDILPGHTDMEYLHGRMQVLPGRAVFWLIIVIPPLLYLAMSLGKKRMVPSLRYEKQMKSRTALRNFLKQCSSGEVAAEVLLNAVREYFNSRFGSSLGALTPEEAKDILKRSAVSVDIQDRCGALIDELTRYVYTGSGRIPFDRSGELFSLVREIDRLTEVRR